MNSHARIFPPPAAVAAALCAAAGLAAAEAAPREWKLPPCATLEGDILTVEIPQGAADLDGRCERELDLGPLLEAGAQSVALEIFARGEGISTPDLPWNGVKSMMRFVDAETGDVRWPGSSAPRGDFGWTNLVARAGRIKGHAFPADGKVALVLGLQGSTGRVQFDLSTLRVRPESLGVPRVNEDYVVRYPEGATANAGDPAANPRPLRGFMLPGRPTREEDIADMAAMGATMARFQITRNWNKIDDNRDLEEYARWIDWRLSNLVDVLDWARRHGLKICIDLHQPPGGKHGVARPEEMAMFTEDEYADAFVDTWRRIASRVKGHPAIYGYDLINEPVQARPVKNDYWELQRRAAEAVREIDPDTPIIVASNLADSPGAFADLSPLAMDNVIYQAHLYAPLSFTHQGVQGRPRDFGGKPFAWPGADPASGRAWDKEFLRETLRPVLEFQRRHKCRIYIGEFSAVCWAPGAENYLRDCISLFEELGWDWTYHAFREAPFWDVEKEGDAPGSIVPAPDTPRKRALLEGFARP